VWPSKTIMVRGCSLLRGQCREGRLLTELARNHNNVDRMSQIVPGSKVLFYNPV
jgi:hypothetical protein